MKKEDEIAATNKLLQIIRGDTEAQEGEESKNDLSYDDSSSLIENSPPESTPIASPEKNVQSQTPDDFYASLPENMSDEKKKAIPHPQKEKDLPQGQPLLNDQLWLINDEEKDEDVPTDRSAPPAVHERKKDEPFLYKQQGEIKGTIKSYLGLDVGSRFIKFIQIQPKMKKQILISWGIIEVPPEEEKITGRPQTDRIKTILRNISNSRIKVISSIGGPSVIVRHIKFPPLSDKEIEDSIGWEAKTYIPFPLRDVNIDYQILGRSPKNKQVDVLLVAVTKKLLKEHLEKLRNIQINPHIVDINSLALANSFAANNDYKEERAVVLLDIGASTTILSIYKKNDLYFTRDIPIAGEMFTRHIQDNKHLSYEEAESSKRDKRFVLDTIKSPLDNLIKEIRRSLIYYDNQTTGKGFSRVILSGGSCRLPGIDGYISEELGLTVEIADPLRSIYVDPKKFSVEELTLYSPYLALAFGLTT